MKILSYNERSEDLIMYISNANLKELLDDMIDLKENGYYNYNEKETELIIKGMQEAIVRLGLEEKMIKLEGSDKFWDV